MPATAFIGLDYIVDIIQPGGAISRPAAHATERGIIKKVNRVLALAQEKDWLRILVKVSFAKNYIDLPINSPIFGRLKEFGALKSGTSGTEFHNELEAERADLIIVKPRISPFYSTSLDAALRARRIERVLIAGVSTSWAVQSAARDAHDRDYEVLIVQDACAATNEEEHLASIRMLSGIAKIITVDEVAAL